MPITEQNREESINFMNAMYKVFDILDNVAPLIGDNNYLQLCNALKIINENRSRETIIRHIEVVREQIRNNPVVLNHQARIRMKTKTKNEMITDAEKLKRGWEVCHKCDRLVKNISHHQSSDVCKRTAESKILTHRSNSITTNKYTHAIFTLRGIFINYNGFKYYMNLIKNKI